jgi:hypothetical protein
MSSPSELMTVKDVSEVLKISEDTVVRRFARVKGVIDLGTGETRNKRRYRVLRIPVSVVEGHLARLSGTAVKIEVPERAERRRKSPQWEERAIMNLAKAALQNGIEGSDKVTFHRVAERARLLQHVPENRWGDVVWFEEEE